MRYFLFAGLALVGPGLAVQRVLGHAIDPALVLPLGFALAAAAHWLSLVTGQAWIFPAVIGLLDLALLVPRGPWRLVPGPSLRGAVAPFLAIVAVLAVTQYPWNRLSPTGDFLLDPLVPYDTAFHVGLARELMVGYPPQVPGVSGFPLGYHLGIDLVRAAALRWARVDPYDSISRFDVTLGALALVLALRGAAQAAGASPRAVGLVGFTLFATDFSFLFGGNPQAHWWSDLLRGNLLLSAALANPILAALALALGSVIALSRHTRGEGRGFLWLAAGLALAVPFFKVFLGAHLLLGLAVAALVRPGDRRAIAAVGLPLLVATAVLVLGQGGRTVRVAIAPLDLVHTARETLGLVPLRGVALLGFAALWLLASLGIRILGLGPAVAALRGGPVAGRALAAMALAAWPLGLVFRVWAPEMLPGQRAVNDAGYLLEQGGALLWIFAAAGLARFPRVVAAALMLLALPATAQFVIKKATEPPDPLPAAVVRAMRALEAASRPGDVVLQRPGARFPPAPVILIGRRVPYERFTPWLTQFVSREDLEKRHQTVFRFFRTKDRVEALGIAAGLGARYVALYGWDRLRFDTAGLLEPIHEEPGARVYRIVPSLPPPP